MRRDRSLRILRGAILCAAAVCVAGHAAAQHDQHAAAGEQTPLEKTLSDPIPLYEEALGPFTRPISSDNEEAQAYFDQGFQLMYAFAKLEAVRSFREAWKRDPNCAICYWGEAWAWGSYLNGKMTAEEAPYAYAALQKALTLKDEHASEQERAFIDALSVRYVEEFDPETRVEQDRAYAASMKALSDRYPDDLDASTLYADALFLLEPRRGRRDVNAPNVRRLHGVLEGVLARDIRHPGACHLYVHATESTTRPDKALACAEHLGNAIPGASHINHMPSHTWNVVGRWGDSVRANLQAWHSDLKADSGAGIAIYPSHNLHMLAFAASMDGQGAIAMQAGRDYTARTGRPVLQLLTAIRFGRFDDVLDVEPRPSGEIGGGIWDFARGYALLRRDGPDFARPYLGRLETLAETSTETFRDHPASRLLGTLAGILDGEILRADGDVEAAIEAFERAVALEDELEYDEPEPLPFAARHWLGAALLEGDRPAEAERVYREELSDHPHNGWSLFGLNAALKAQGKESPEVAADLKGSWARSDTWISASRF
jgi:tetratricopeptide (TPR) repeat protein